ncbi:MAG TPA: glycoside hydrolase family 88 protein [Bacteroides reticulotermitis]|nr:glycoside hydrolase family 88 protein [Bacteroides reticulotermitis]
MRTILVSFLSFFILVSCSKQEPMENLINRVFTVAEQQYIAMDTRLTAYTLPRTLSADGEFVSSNIYWWCSGFYPGSLWYIYEYTSNDAVKALAEKNTLKLDSVQYVTRDHDVGFQLNCSYGNAFRLTGNEAYKQVLYQGAKSLSTRFNPATGVIRSWDFVRKGCDWKFPVIIDNMMNLELLLSMSNAYADDSLQVIACTHANTTIRNHFRDDYSTYHLVDYDPTTGEVRGKQTVQGFSDDSSWSRGQAWALYSYTMMFRLTGYQNYLLQDGHIADMLIRRLPNDGIPYWDFDAPVDDKTYRDASAAAIMASAFIELSRYIPGAEAKELYLATAEKQLRTLASSEYLAEPGTNGNFILKHSAGAIPDKNEMDVPLTYADYYFLEALLRYKNLQK